MGGRETGGRGIGGYIDWRMLIPNTDAASSIVEGSCDSGAMRVMASLIIA
jgi:hypothetical protein